MNLMICGDSIMKGVRFDDNEQRYKLCRSKNFDLLTANGVTVCNRSKMGATVERGVSLWENDEKTTDTVLLEYGGNDCDYDWQAVSDDPDGAHLPHIGIDTFTGLYTGLIRRIRALGGTVILSSLLPIDAEKYFAWITRGRNDAHILSWLGDVGMLARWQESYQSAILGIARRENCPVLDIRTPFLLNRDFRELLCADGIHPTQKGHDLIERCMLEYFG